MATISTEYQFKSRSSLATHGNAKSFSALMVSPLLTTAFWLAALSTTNAQQSVIPASPVPAASQQTLAAPLPGLRSYGNQISLNGRTLPAAWFQRPGTAGKVSTYLNDAALRQLIGMDLLNTSTPARQPVQWFSLITPLTSLLTPAYRYLDVTDFLQRAGWQLQANGNTLVISTPTVKVADIRQGKQPWGDRIVIDLDRPTPWQLTQELVVKKPQPPKTPTPNPQQPLIPTVNLQPPQTPTVNPQPSPPIPPPPPNTEWTVTLDGTVDPVLIERFTPPSVEQVELGEQEELLTPNSSLNTPPPLIKQVEKVGNQTVIRLSVPFGLAPRISSLPNPNRLIIDIRPDALPERDILWAQGLRWRQQYVNLGADRFPVVWLEVNPRTVGITIKPFWSSPETLVGTAPLIQTAQKYLAAAAINGGFFNRNNRLPLGAIRQNGKWLSSPILNRGAIAWNDSGQIEIGRLTLQETLITANNQRLPILNLNSGYVQTGIARYAPDWGTTYAPLTDNEIIVVVQNNKVTNQLPGGIAGKTTFPIPADGYLLALRANAAAANSLPVGSLVRTESVTIPADFSRYPHILGAGPLLLQNGQIVLDAKAEKFSDAFIAEKAARSAICTTATGTVFIAAVHNRAGGAGPTLAENAQLMQQLGCVNALNLDGGSSTSLYLGGQLLDRSPRTAARVHNGIGIFLQSR